MAQLRWDPVAAPDFSNSMQGISAANGLIQQALNGAQTGVAKYNSILDERAQKVLAEHMLSIQDPEAYKAALANGTLFDGVNKDRLSPEQIMAAGNRYGTLLSQANSELALTENKYDYGRKVDRNAATDAAAPILQQAAMLSNSGKPEEATKLLQDNAAIIGRLSAADVTNALQNNQGLASSHLGYDRAVWSYGNDKQDRADQDVEKAALDQLTGLYDKSSQIQALQGMNLPAGSKAAIWQRLGLPGAIDDLSAGITTGGGFGAAGGGGTFSMGAPQQAVASVLSSSGLSPSVVAGFMGNFHIEGGYGGAAGDGGQARGIAQWHPDRLGNFKAVTGKDFSQATPEDQAKFVVWELNNPEKAGMTQQQATAIKSAKTPQEAAALIDQFYERSSGKAVGARVNAATQAAALLGQAADAAQRGYNAADQYGAINANNNSARWAALQADQTPIAQVVKGLHDSAFPSASTDQLLSRIKEVQARAQRQHVTLTPSTAADILASSIKQRGFGDKASDLGKYVIDPFNLFTEKGGLGGNTEVDYGMVDSMIKNAVPRKDKNGMMISPNEQYIRDSTIIQANQAQQAQAQAQLAQAQMEYQRAKAAFDRGQRVNLQPYIDRLNQAGELVNGAQNVLQPVPPVQTAPVRQATAPARKVVAAPKAVAPTDHSSAAARARAANAIAAAASGAGSAIQYINPIYWAGRAISGQ